MHYLQTKVKNEPVSDTLLMWCLVVEKHKFFNLTNDEDFVTDQLSVEGLIKGSM